MTRSLRRIALFVVAASAGHLAGCGSAASPTAPQSTAKFDSFKAAIDSWARTAGHLGVSASIVLADGSQWTGVAGRAGSTEAMRLEHLIAIASITKTMTAAVVMQLADESRLTLDDPISRWLDARPNVNPAITIRQLLNHTNGLDNYTASSGLGQAINADPSHVFSPDELLGFVGPPKFAPGSQTEYTNTAFLLLGQIAERVTGRSIVTLWHQRLWDPLRLKNVFLPGIEAPPGPLAMALTTSGLAAPLERMSVLSAGSTAFGVMANAQDIAQWGHALFTGSVISGRLQQEMRTLVPAAGNIPGESGAGLGIRGYSYLGRSQIGHSGGSSFGNSLLLHDPAGRITVVVIMNQGGGADHFTLGPALLEIALR